MSTLMAPVGTFTKYTHTHTQNNMENNKAHSYTDTTAHTLENKGSLDALKNTSHQEPKWFH